MITPLAVRSFNRVIAKLLYGSNYAAFNALGAAINRAIGGQKQNGLGDFLNIDKALD